MASLRPTLGGAGVADDEWIEVDEGAAVGTARRRSAAFALRTGLGEDRAHEVEVIASELASNIVKHGRGGDLLLQAGPGAGMRLIAIDAGPGTRDLEALIDDGASTAGTLGVGLGAVRRWGSRVALWSEPARGAVVVVDVDPPDGTDEHLLGRLVRPLRGESVSGDSVAHRRDGPGWLLMVADGLGHGTLAAQASQRAVEVFQTAPSTVPADLLERMHRALAGTRGAAVAVSAVDLRQRALTHAAVGNISGRLVGAPGTRSQWLATQPGIVGHNVPRIREVRYDLGDTQLAVLHSDGLTEKWDGSALPAVTRHGATVCAAVLHRDAAVRRDDASVLALQVSR